MKFGFIIPVYNHGGTLENVVKNLLPYNFPIIVIDDGNDEKNRNQINDVAKKYPLVELVVCKKNGGKGKAMKAGVFRAEKLGLTHILQIDSDGQHDVSRIDDYFRYSRENPDAVICGCPEYDKDAPKERVNGRKFANMWIHIVTLSNEIKDAMIGFRVYPIKPYMKVVSHNPFIDNRMGFDIEILVRLMWKGVHIISKPVKVFYPADGISNYRYVRDTLHISFTYARLCIGMILRLPLLIARKIGRRK